MSWRDRSYSSSGGYDDGGGFRAGSSFSQNPLNYAPTLGTIFGIRVQIHIVFIIFVAIELLRAGMGGHFAWHLRYLAILFGLVFLHELGHCFGARRVGGSATNILMWPLGGLAYVGPPHRPGAHLFTAFAGPAVNIGFCILSAAVLIGATGSLGAVPWNPYAIYRTPEALDFVLRSQIHYWIFQFFLINYILLLFNMCLPFYPFDGGRILQALLWYRIGYNRSMTIATTIGMVGAVLIGCYGLFTIQTGGFMLVFIGIFGYIACWQQRKMITMTGGGYAGTGDGFSVLDLSAAHTQADKPTRRSRRQEGAWVRKQKSIAEEQAEVDRILQKVHREGLASLTRREKSTLSRATRRQQERDRELGRIDRL